LGGRGCPAAARELGGGVAGRPAARELGGAEKAGERDGCRLIFAGARF
jgi:hypothetical protein